MQESYWRRQRLRRCLPRRLQVSLSLRRLSSPFFHSLLHSRILSLLLSPLSSSLLLPYLLLSHLPSPFSPLPSPLSLPPPPFSPLPSPLSLLPSPSPLSLLPSPFSPLPSPLSLLPSPFSPLPSPLSFLHSPLGMSTTLAASHLLPSYKLLHHFLVHHLRSSPLPSPLTLSCSPPFSLLSLTLLSIVPSSPHSLTLCSPLTLSPSAPPSLSHPLLPPHSLTLYSPLTLLPFAPPSLSHPLLPPHSLTLCSPLTLPSIANADNCNISYRALPLPFLPLLTPSRPSLQPTPLLAPLYSPPLSSTNADGYNIFYRISVTLTNPGEPTSVAVTMGSDVALTLATSATWLNRTLSDAERAKLGVKLKPKVKKGKLMPRLPRFPLHSATHTKPAALWCLIAQQLISSSWVQC
ncbi:unnamed protein product [Closterium sp. NIES-64]|nr:unnamed protein product [Closterium sp. NIES-64]